MSSFVSFVCTIQTRGAGWRWGWHRRGAGGGSTACCACMSTRERKSARGWRNNRARPPKIISTAAYAPACVCCAQHSLVGRPSGRRYSQREHCVGGVVGRAQRTQITRELQTMVVRPHRRWHRPTFVRHIVGISIGERTAPRRNMSPARHRSGLHSHICTSLRNSRSERERITKIVLTYLGR